MNRSFARALVLLLLVGPPCSADDFGAGWRGNWTGLWPNAKPPLEWHRLPKGVLTDLRARTDKPAEKEGEKGNRIEDGLVHDWLVLGPFPVGDSVKDFDRAQLDVEKVRPGIGDRDRGLTWQRVEVPPEDPMAFGKVDLPWLDFLPTVGGFKPNQVAYAHTYLYTPRGGTVRAVVEHAHGLKAWVNGKEVYSSPNRGLALGNYVNLSRHELNHWNMPSPRFDVPLRAGWNRLLLKVSTSNKDDFKEMRVCLRLMDLPDVPYDSKNILWMTELPGRSNATPIVVGDRIFVMAEPDQVLCLDRKTGRVLWLASVSYHDALTAAERQGNAAYRTKVDPLIGRLKEEKDRARRAELRAKLKLVLSEIDSSRFEIKANGHFEAHFGIVGLTTPTPVSDGKNVYVWCNNGVAACFDLDGKRQWITRIDVGALSYGSSPALAGGILAVFNNRLFGLDARTGQVRWRQPRVSNNNGAVLPARIAGTPVFVSQKAAIVRAADGKILFRTREESGDTGWAPPVILGDIVYSLKYGVAQLTAFDFAGVRGEEWKPKTEVLSLPEEISRGPKGNWVDRWTAGSPLVLDGLAYTIDIYGCLYAVDLKTKRMVYCKETELRGLMHYNAVPVAASPTLVGKHIVVQDNQGTALVLEPGRAFRQRGKNRIATQLDRWWPIPAQETLSYAPPVLDGNRLYLRGERYLYCIGEKE